MSIAGDLVETVGSKVDRRSSRPQLFIFFIATRLLLAGRTEGPNRESTPHPRKNNKVGDNKKVCCEAALNLLFLDTLESWKQNKNMLAFLDIIETS